MSPFDNTLGQRPKKYPAASGSDPSAELRPAASPLDSLSTLGAPRPHAPAVSPTAPLNSAPAQPYINRPKDPALAALQTSYAPVRQGYDAANAQVQDLTAKRDALQGVVKPDLVIPRNDFAPVTQVSATPGGVTALQAVTSQLGQATQARDAYVPKLNAVAQGFRGYTDRTNANTLLRQSGVAPLPLPPSAPATTPARNPAATGTPASPGGISASDFSNVQGTPKLQVNLGAGNGYGGGGVVRDSLASSVTNGVPTYDNASIARLNARNGVTSAATSAVPLPLPSYAATPVATPNLAVNVPRPVTADPYNTRQANDDLKSVRDTIDTELFRNSFAADRGSRSAREAQAQMLGTLAALGGKKLDVAANVASGNRDAAAGYDLTGMHLNAQNQQALLKDQGDTTRTGMLATSAERQQYLQSLAELNKPSDVTDAEGNLQRVSGLIARPVLDQNGRQVQTATKSVTPDANTIVAQYNERAKALDEAAAAYGNGKPADYTALDASPLGQAYRQVFAGLRTPTSADVAKLRAHPEWASYFDQAFGKGAAGRALGGSQ